MGLKLHKNKITVGKICNILGIFIKTFINRAFNRHAIYGGLRDAGLIEEDGKFYEENILQQCPHYNTLDIEKQNWLVSKRHEFYQIFNENGCIPEEAYEK